MKVLTTRKRLFMRAGMAVLALFVVYQLAFSPVSTYQVLQAWNRGTVPYKTFFEGFDKYAINAESLKDNYVKEKVKSSSSGEKEFLFSKEYLEGILDISEDTFNQLKSSHERYVNEHMKNLIEKAGVTTFGELTPKSPQWSTYRGSSGFVLIGGGKYSWLSYLVIKQIRATGSKLPIEVFIPTETDRDPRFCDEVLPKLGAKCNMLSQELVEYLGSSFNIGGYQYKMLALLASSFENVVYLDSDLYPLKDIQYLLDSDLYKTHGLILWPDFWARTTNPKFHEISGLEVPEKKVRYSDYDLAQAKKAGTELKPLEEYTFKDSNFHDFENTLPDPSSEAGVMLVNKTSHMRTLLLALYYNVFGPKFYYPLMTQGGAGEGDKETFIAAASVMREKYFQTLKKFKWIGYNTPEKFESKALGHYDPISAKANDDPAPLVFSHCSYPKHYTDWMYNNHDLIHKESGEHIRMYKDTYENIGYDLDLRLLSAYTEALCEDIWHEKEKEDKIPLDQRTEYMGNYLHYIDNDREVNKKRCAEVYIPHLKWLKETTEYPDTLNF